MTVPAQTITETPEVLKVSVHPKLPELPERFALLKRDIIKPEHEEKVKASYKRLLVALEAKTEEIAQAGSSYVPEVKWSDIKANNNVIPDETIELFKERGCIIVRGVIPESVAEKWFENLQDFVTKHPEVGGYPQPYPANWFAYWTEGQVQARSHPEIMKLMKVMGQVWHAGPDTLIDTDSQVVYADRFRIRYPGKQVSLMLHLDSGAIERWEDDQYRSVYQKIFEGDWEEFDPFSLDARPNAKSDLYSGLAGRPSACSAFRSLQGWLSLSDTKKGEGTVRFLPDLKLAMAYMMLRPFFWKDDENLDFETSKFPGAVPGSGQYFPNAKWYPHLNHEKSVVGITDVRPGDYVFWHCDLAHEVDKLHPGTKHSSVFFNPQVPLCPYNIENMIKVRSAFEMVMPPADFLPDLEKRKMEKHYESEYPDHGARLENILTDDGMRAMGLKAFDIDEPGLTPGQKEVRKMANEAILESFGSFKA
ncbi:unnamed protein product [Kuraishia capsulata CBS 1993]|uniref:DUF1479-domain-containing protein n=1 Tax=Kuraishia capsulata CBS 1993 TaxID=1382522 RepID=W6MKB3_9ASCO|nr:uncharacterized protein KUCA_T00002946001 [Kuraishia capsulata CBS 1993]CDK26969.1 unnamed protein product [Kuraishia capsulata CBS 1993]